MPCLALPCLALPCLALHRRAPRVARRARVAHLIPAARLESARLWVEDLRRLAVGDRVGAAALPVFVELGDGVDARHEEQRAEEHGHAARHRDLRHRLQAADAQEVKVGKLAHRVELLVDLHGQESEEGVAVGVHLIRHVRARVRLRAQPVQLDRLWEQRVERARLGVLPVARREAPVGHAHGGACTRAAPARRTRSDEREPCPPPPPPRLRAPRGAGADARSPGGARPKRRKPSTEQRQAALTISSVCPVAPKIVLRTAAHGARRTLESGR